MTFRPFCALLVVGAVVLTSGCRDPLQLPLLPVFQNSFVLRPLNTPDPTAYSALSLPSVEPRRITGALDFDVAFDTTAGRIALYPVSIVGSSTRQVSLQAVEGELDDVTEAPRDGYSVNETLVVDVGQVFIIEAQVAVCRFDLSPFVYAKVVVDSVKEETGLIYVSALGNPNCGRRDLTTPPPDEPDPE